MRSVDFSIVRGGVSLLTYLDSIGWDRARKTKAACFRGICPLHGSSSGKSKAFQAAPHLDRWYCHKCKVGGDVIDLHAMLNPGLGLSKACNDLAARFLGIGPLAAQTERGRGTGKGSVGELPQANTHLHRAGAQASQAAPDHTTAGRS